MSHIADNIREIKEIIKSAEQRSEGRSSDVLLVAVTKTRSAEEINRAIEAGITDIGENRVQEITEKHDKVAPVRWHMIGHLQSNKVKDLFKVHNLTAIHSVDSFSLIESLLKYQDRLTHQVDIFLQFNTSGEEEKSGFEKATDLDQACELLKNSQVLKVAGLMTMGALRVEDQLKSALACFKELARIRDELSQKLKLPLALSMGMSQDYRLALSCGSNWLRLGTMMFELH